MVTVTVGDDGTLLIEMELFFFGDFAEEVAGFYAQLVAFAGPAQAMCSLDRKTAVAGAVFRLVRGNIGSVRAVRRHGGKRHQGCAQCQHEQGSECCHWRSTCFGQ